MRRGSTLLTAVLALATALLAVVALPAAVPASVSIPPPQQPLWVWQNPLPQGNSLGSVQVIDAWRAVAVGDAGTILTTVDGGASWNRAISGVGQTLFGVRLRSTGQGWAVGAGGVVLDHHRRRPHLAAADGGHVGVADGR